MPGRHVTDHQMRLYMTFRQTDGPAIAAAKASISTASAYRYEQHHQLPSSQRQATRSPTSRSARRLLRHRGRADAESGAGPTRGRDL